MGTTFQVSQIGKAGQKMAQHSHPTVYAYPRLGLGEDAGRLGLPPGLSGGLLVGWDSVECILKLSSIQIILQLLRVWSVTLGVPFPPTGLGGTSGFGGHSSYRWRRCPCLCWIQIQF